ncbi:MAG: S1 RNA-binding domain-containing protein [Sandaracinaceae bacterium]|nr:S1 RNA-binding domain-containing protein [Sandaracinaceae bacterium]
MSKGDSESFAELFAREGMPGRRARALTIGDEVEGVVGHVSADAVFVDVDAKTQAFFAREELPEAALGARVKGHVIAVDPKTGEIQLGRAIGRRDASAETLRIALDQGIAIEGKVVAINKGGAEVEIAGQRGFCPLSQLDQRRVEDPAALVGQVLRFKVVEVRDRDVVLSRRRLLEEEAFATREALRSRLEVGAVLQGRVVQIREFGAFVDLGGLEGLIPLRELAHDRVQRAEDVLAIGDVVEVKIVKLEHEGDRLKLTLSLRALATDPWDGIGAIAPVGRVLGGQVTRLADYGAFVRLAAGVEGLLHVSELGARVKHPQERLSVGDHRLVVVKEVDRERKRVSLALADEGANEGEIAKTVRVVMGAVVKAVVEKHERFGVFVQIAGTQGRAGRALVPTAELALRAGADVRKELPIGAEITAKVIDAAEGRVRLSVRASREDDERAVYDTYREQQGGKAMGTFADLLKGKLDK